jgi:uncharacterized protein with ParB-like and HNH nuclease domain
LTKIKKHYKTYKTEENMCDITKTELPCIITIKELLKISNLGIPDYQRPYKWTTKNVNQLMDDIFAHYEKKAYRLGTLVIHKHKDKNNNEVLDIVDGQQRTITLVLIACAILKNKMEILKKINHNENWNEYIKLSESEIFSFSNDISKENININYKEIERRIYEFDEKIIYFFFNKCQLVRVIINDISEAFQFFDSQNARGKDLEPHDLLKAYHLRAMNNFSTEEERKQAVDNWEKMETEKLSELFSEYLYRIRNWSKGYSAKYFTKEDVDIFKGVSPDIQEEYPFIKMYRIVHYYTENYNHSYHKNIEKHEYMYPFQIDQTIINGKRFFEMIDFYNKKISEIKSEELIILEKKNKDYSVLELINDYEGNFRKGDKLIRKLFNCGLIYFIDKFGHYKLHKAIDKIFIWAYTLRLKLQNVGLNSIDNYALNKAHSKIQFFKEIREAIHPNDFLHIKLEVLNKNESTKTEKIVELFKEVKYYE